MALEKAKFINNDNNNTIAVQFNPSSLSIMTSAIVSEQKTQQLESDSVIINMGGIKSRQLGVSLVFDTYQSGSGLSLIGLGSKQESVKKVIDNFETFMNSSSEISFIWGKIIFKGFINSLTSKYEMFASDGTPVRATVEISMEESAYQGEEFSAVKWNEDEFNIEDMNEEEMVSKIISSIGG